MIELRQKRVLVTGSNGFFGRHIVNELHKYGVRYNLFTPSSTDYDLRVRAHVDAMLDSTHPDVVIHAAAHCGGIGLNKLRPANLFYDNMMMGTNLIDAAWHHGVQKFVQLGTVCEYPKFTPVPFHEEDLWNGYPEETNAPYGVAKKALLVMGQAYRQQYGFNVIHLLPVNLYGPGDHFDPQSSHVIPALIRNFEEARVEGRAAVTIWGTGNAYREFLYVEDAAAAIVLAAERYDGHDPVNIGTGVTIQIRDLATMIAKKVGFQGEIRFDTTMPDGQPKRCLDTERASQEFGFTAETSFDAGLDKTIAWYRQCQNASYTEFRQCQKS